MQETFQNIPAPMFRVHPALFRTDVVQARTPGVQFWTVLDLLDALIPKVRSPFPPVSTGTDADPHLACLLHNKNKKWIKSLGLELEDLNRNTYTIWKRTNFINSRRRKR